MISEITINVEDIRKQSFGKKYALDFELINIVKSSPENEFLTNPPIHTVYLYLVDLVVNLSEKWFDKGISKIKVLDWGAGKGHISYFLANRNANITSCDIFDTSAHDSTFGQDTPILNKLNFKIDPLNHPYILPYENNSFDVVLSFGVLEHVPNDKESIKEISRVLKKGGLFFCFHLPQPYSWTQKLEHIRGNFYHDRFYNSDSIKQLSELGEFDVLDIWHRAFFPKNKINFPFYRILEKFDLFLTENTILKYFATNIEFIASKK